MEKKRESGVVAVEMPEYGLFPVPEEKPDAPIGTTEPTLENLDSIEAQKDESLDRLRTRVERDTSDRMLWDVGFSARSYLHGIISTSRKASVKRRANEMKIMQAQLRSFYPEDVVYADDWTPQKDIALHHILQMCERNERRHSEAFKRLQTVQTRLEYPALVCAAIGSAISASGSTHSQSPIQYYASTVIQLVISMLLAAKITLGVDRLIPHEMRMCKGFHTLSIDIAITLTQRPEDRKQNGDLTLQEFKQRYCELQKMTEDITPGRGVDSNTWQIYVKDLDLESPGLESVATHRDTHSEEDDSQSGTNSGLERLDTRRSTIASTNGAHHSSMGSTEHPGHSRPKPRLWYESNDGRIESP